MVLFNAIEPGMGNDGFDVNSLVDFAVEHAANEVDGVFAHDVRDSEVAVHDFVNAVEWVFLVDNGVHENS